MAAKLRPRVMLPRCVLSTVARATEARGRQLQRLVGPRANEVLNSGESGGRRALEAKLLEFVLSEGCVPFEKVLVELRRLDASAGKHGVGLSAVVDLMDE